MSVWSVKVVLSVPAALIPGPTMPSHVVVISGWKSPWIQANCGLEHTGVPGGAGLGQSEAFT